MAPGSAMNLKEFRCAKCGYGISLSGALPICPMCQSTGWNPRPYEPRGAEMAEARTPPEDKGDAEKRAQRALTTSVGTPLVRHEKKSRRRLFGRRRTTPSVDS
jgi:hypothetical protein